MVPEIKDLILRVNLSVQHVNKVIKVELQWRDILVEWCKVHYVDSFSGSEVSEEIIWLNSNICIGDKPALNLACIKAGMVKFRDIMKNGKRMEYSELPENQRKAISWLEYSQLVSAIPKIWWYLYGIENESGTKPLITFEELSKHNPCSSFVYNHIINSNVDEIIENKYCKYVAELNMDNTRNEYFENFSNLYQIAKDTKARNFQYRQLLFNVYTNTTLYTWKLIQTPKYEYCNEIQTRRHLFFECHKTQDLFRLVQEWFGGVLDITYTSIFICKVQKPPKALANYIILLTKMYIYSNKCLNRNILA